ncbi:MAG: molybdenum cofactor guanylyltransferase [Anaerolineales bacterium]|nr:molybdenum cofactor guanylyltransferase [Anaerolineales bacterium]
MLTVAIQAGGESRRMGQDKGLVPFLGQPLIQRVTGRLAPIADEILITTNHPQSYGFLKLRLEPDLIPGRGALGGLYTALSAAAQPFVAVVACDMPFANPQLLRAGLDLLLTTQADLAIPQTATGMQPFHAVYRRATCLPAIRQALEAGKWRADAWYEQVAVQRLSEQEIAEHDPQGISFWNINTPEDLLAAEEYARGRHPRQA